MSLPDDFDYKIYLDINNDLPHAGINTQELAARHYIHHGQNEGRKYKHTHFYKNEQKDKIYMELPHDFDYKSYLDINDDLPFAGINTEELAINHYVTYGKNEGRKYINKQILHLVLYSKNDMYDEMYNTTNEYYKSFNNKVTTIYYMLSNDIQEEYVLKDNILFIKGEERYSNITYKFIKALKYFYKDINCYDYVVRSNISSIINLNILLNTLKTDNICYGGSTTQYLNWLDEQGGLIDSSLFGLFFFQGTFFIFNKLIWRLIDNYENDIRYDIIDDVAISLFIQEKIENIKITKLPYLIVENFNGNYEALHNFIQTKKHDVILYRNKNRCNYKVDIEQMKKIVDIIK
jgi:hypothetical protein